MFHKINIEHDQESKCLKVLMINKSSFTDQQIFFLLYISLSRELQSMLSQMVNSLSLGTVHIWDRSWPCRLLAQFV